MGSCGIYRFSTFLLTTVKATNPSILFATKKSLSGSSSGFGNCPALKLQACLAYNTMSQTNHAEPNSIKIDVGGSLVDIVAAPGVNDSDLRRAIDSNPFKQWLANLKSMKGILAHASHGGASCTLRKVTIQNVDMFGQRVGFVKFKAEVVDDATGKTLPGVVFARGGAVAILMLLECNGETFAVLTEQARVPVGRVILELPAGMLDDDAGDFVGTAAREVEEEIGIHIKSSDLVDLTNFLDESTGKKMFPSPGGCDEEITLMLYRNQVSREVIDSLQGQKTGLQDHGEFIKVHVVPYDSLWRSTADSKALAAITLYERAKKEGLLPPYHNAESKGVSISFYQRILSWGISTLKCIFSEAKDVLPKYLKTCLE